MPDEKSSSGNINISDISGGEIRAEGGIFTVGGNVDGDVAGRDIITYTTNIIGGETTRSKPELPLLPYEPETILVSAGPFIMGSEDGAGVPDYEMPQYEVDLLAYHIGKYPVTNKQYAEFIRQTGRIVAPEAGWDGQTPRQGKDNHPVAGVTWSEALDFCRWLSEQTQRNYTLPSEAQWEKAARGPHGQIYPWGNEWDPSRCNHSSDQTTPVDAYPEGVSPYGCYDMVGNVREWTSTLWGVQENKPDPQFCPPWTDDSRENLAASKFILRVYRGGAAADKLSRLRGNARGAYFPNKPGPPRKRHGFRVVLKV